MRYELRGALNLQCATCTLSEELFSAVKSIPECKDLQGNVFLLKEERYISYLGIGLVFGYKKIPTKIKTKKSHSNMYESEM